MLTISEISYAFIMTTIAFLVSEITKAIFLVENNICKQDKAIAYSCVHRSSCAGPQ